MNKNIKVVLWDIGGVLTESPFDLFTKYEKSLSIPVGSIIKINSKNPLNNAWAKFEKDLITKKKFVQLFKKEAEDLSLTTLDPLKVINCLNLKVMPNMVKILDKVKSQYLGACLTNNFNNKYLSNESKRSFEKIKKKFDIVFESSKMKMRKPEKKMYEFVIKNLGVRSKEILFIDDLGMNLKIAKKLGMQTYKSTNPDQTITFLNKVLEIENEKYDI